MFDRTPIETIVAESLGTSMRVRAHVHEIERVAEIAVNGRAGTGGALLRPSIKQMTGIDTRWAGDPGQTSQVEQALLQKCAEMIVSFYVDEGRIVALWLREYLRGAAVSASDVLDDWGVHAHLKWVTPARRYGQGRQRRLMIEHARRNLNAARPLAEHPTRAQIHAGATSDVFSDVMMTIRAALAEHANVLDELCARWDPRPATTAAPDTGLLTD